MNAPSERLIDLMKGWPNPALLPSEAVRAAATAALSDPNVFVPGMLYGPDWGYAPLREAIAAWLSAFYECPERIDPERLCISGGASQNLACILQSYTDPIYTRNIWMVSPTYFLACRTFEDSGFRGRLRSVPEGDEGIDLDFLRNILEKSEEEATKSGNTEPTIKPARPWNKIYRHLVYAVPTFSNPSAKTMSLVRRQQLVRLAREYDCLVITDDVYDWLQWSAPSTSAATTSTLAKPVSTDLQHAVLPRIVDIDRSFEGGSERPGADGFGNTVSNGSFSKIVAPGVRTGWAEGTAKFAYGLSQVGSSRSGGAPSHMTATFLSNLLASGTVQSHIAQTLQPAYASRHGRLTAAISRHLLPLGVTMPGQDHGADLPARISGGYFTWIILPPGLRADDVAAKCREWEQLVIAPGSLFAVSGDEGAVDLERGVRLTFAWETEDQLEEGVMRLGKVVRRMLALAPPGGLDAA